MTQARIHTGFHRFTENGQILQIDIFLIKKKLSKLQGFIRGEWNWPISCLNDFGSQEIKGDFRELKSKKFPGAACPRTPPRSKRLRCSFRKSVSHYILIRACDHTCGSITFFSENFTQNILKINEAIVVLRSLRYI